MATRYIQQANQAVQPVYNQANQGIQQQASAVDMLYGALFGGAEAQQQELVQQVLQSAAQRGVGRAGLEGDTMAQLQPTADLNMAQLGVQQAQQLADIRGQRGQAQMGRVQAATDLGGSIQDRVIGDRDAQLQRQISQEETQMQMQELERADQIRQQAYAQAQARAASSASDKIDPEAIDSFINVNKGEDGNVSPETFHQGLFAWLEAGGTEDAYINRYRNAVNLKHKEDYYNIDKFMEKKRIEFNDARSNYKPSGRGVTIPGTPQF